MVRKRLKAGGSPDEFEREDKCLRLLNGLRHPNIVPFLGSYTHKQEFCFLFPYIQTDLGKFLTSECRHGGFQLDFTFYAALAGLASALAKTHRLVLDEEEHGIQFQAIGYHHDIRPPNVLVSHDNFILADFGLGRLKDGETLSLTPYKPISGDYIAPECTDMEENGQIVNRAIDVWAFGCLILEVVTYLLKGASGIIEFRRTRLTPGRLSGWKDSGFYAPQAHGGVKQEVKNWVGELTRDSSATDTETYLLKLGLDALHVDPETRPTMDELYRRLAGASMLKHFDSVKDMFQRVRGAASSDPSSKQHHLESLRLAQERFGIWGRVLSLCEISTSGRYENLPGKTIEVLTTLFHQLREEPEKQAPRDLTSLRFVEDKIDRSVKELWDMLPSDLFILANNLLQQNPAGHDTREQVPSPSLICHGEMHNEGADASNDALLRAFEDLAQSFKNDLSESISWDELMTKDSIDDVYDIIDDLQHSQELRNLSKMEQCLERLSCYTQTMNDNIRGTSVYSALIWAPLGFLLRRSSAFDTAYIAVIAATAKMGESLPDFRAPDALLIQNTQSKEVIILLFKDILEFYSVMLRPFSQPGIHNIQIPTTKHSIPMPCCPWLTVNIGWTFIFDLSWPRVWALLLEVSSHISRLTRLMRIEISLEHIHQEYEFRKNAMKDYKKQARESGQQEFNRIKTSLRPREYHDTLYELRGVRSSGTGSWLLRNNSYTECFDNLQGTSRVLWLQGIPGAGMKKSIQVDRSLERSLSIRSSLIYVPLSTRQDGPVFHCGRSS